MPRSIWTNPRYCRRLCGQHHRKPWVALHSTWGYSLGDSLISWALLVALHFGFWAPQNSGHPLHNPCQGDSSWEYAGSYGMQEMEQLDHVKHPPSLDDQICFQWAKFFHIFSLHMIQFNTHPNYNPPCALFRKDTQDWQADKPGFSMVPDKQSPNRREKSR